MIIKLNKIKQNFFTKKKKNVHLGLEVNYGRAQRDPSRLK